MSATCHSCGTAFDVDPSVAGKYPGWTPSQCRSCWRKSRGGTATSAGRSGGAGKHRRKGTLVEENLTTAEVLQRYQDGPSSGVFTDGSATPNPGPGGWGAVYVRNGDVLDRSHGKESHTTNNRMELMALSAGVDLVPPDTAVTIYTDSRLVVDTLTKWALGWEKKGWKRKGGEIKNLDLIKPLFAKVRNRPEISIEWIAAHSGNRWNEYADSLSTAYLREVI
ncbi:MAG: ribonuclease H family protein [Euzebya sp.]